MIAACGSLWSRALPWPGPAVSRNAALVGNQLHVMDARANSAYFGYDALYRRTAVMDPLEAASYFAYDAVGNQLRTRDPEARAVYLTYDDEDRLSTQLVQVGGGETTSYCYDKVGNRVSTTDPLSRVTRFGYDEESRLVRTLNPASEATYFAYDLIGSRTREQDGRANATYYRYDPLNRLAAVEDALGTSSYYAYDPAGNLAHEMDARARTTYFAYDAVGRQLAIGYQDGTSHYYAYDDVGSLVRAAAPHGTSYFAYDNLNKQIRDQEPLVGTAYFEYDPAGSRTKVTYPDGGDAVYVFDQANRMSRVLSPDSKATYYTYDASGLELRRLLGNQSRTYFAYDDAGRLSYRKNAQSDGTPLAYFEYGRLAGGNVSRILREAGNTIYYTYDDADRLVVEDWRAANHSQIYAFGYDYDAAGNRVAEDKNGTSVYYHYDEANQLNRKEAVGTGWTYYAYDENGSMRREQAPAGTTYYEYGDNGLTRKIIPPTGDPTEMFYDARMQRFAIDFAGTLAYFGWDGLNQMVEKDASLSTVAEHTHSATPIEGIGSVIVTKRGAEYQYPHYDHRGTLFVLEDTGVSNLVAEFNAFGEELLRSGAAVTRFGYQGTAWMRLDSGLLVPPTQLYVPGRGRFAQRNVWPGLRLRNSASHGSTLGQWTAWALQRALGRLVSRARRLRLNLYDFLRSSPPRLVEPYSEGLVFEGDTEPYVPSDPAAAKKLAEALAALAQIRGSVIPEYDDMNYIGTPCAVEAAKIKSSARNDEETALQIVMKLEVEFEGCPENVDIQWRTCFRESNRAAGWMEQCSNQDECSLRKSIMDRQVTNTHAEIRYMSCDNGGEWALHQYPDDPKARVTVGYSLRAGRWEGIGPGGGRFPKETYPPKQKPGRVIGVMGDPASHVWYEWRVD